jgi:hypothetical protein
MDKGQADHSKAAARPWDRIKLKANRIAAGLTHGVFVLAVALIVVRGSEPLATVNNDARLQDGASAPGQEPQRPDAALLPQPQGEDGDARSDETPEESEQFQMAQRSRRRRREEREEPPPEPAQPLPTPSRSSADQARANRLMDRLVAAYPDFLSGHDENNLIWRDGERMGFDDGVQKTFAERLERPDIEDQFAFPYPLGEMLSDPEPDYDPGRFRNTAFFTKMYGDCRRRGEVQKRLVDVVWLPRHWGKKIKVTPVNGVAEKLQRVSEELDALPEDLQKYLKPPAGTYNCRDIANTSRTSAHGYGIAVDINSAHSDYWEWRGRRSADALEYRNRIPYEIAAIFEKHGFIWGGKWHHYDTMHFEYRPELLVADEGTGTGNTAVPMPVKQPRNLN